MTLTIKTDHEKTADSGIYSAQHLAREFDKLAERSYANIIERFFEIICEKDHWCSEYIVPVEDIASLEEDLAKCEEKIESLKEDIKERNDTINELKDKIAELEDKK